MTRKGRLLKYAIILTALLLFAVALSLWLPLNTAPLVGVKHDFAITHVNILNTIDGSVKEDMTVLVKDGRITSIASSSQLSIPPGFHVIAGKGKYLLPGLWDMHTHSLKISPQLHHPLFIRYGVTSIRDMSGCLDQDDSYWACPVDREQWNTQSIAGELVSPRYSLQSSYQTNGGGEVPDSFPEFFRVQSYEDAKRLAEFYAAQGVDFIKAYTELTSEQFRYLSEAAAQHQLDIAGHKPLTVSLEQALAAGMSSIEHGRLFMFECYKGMEEFRALEDPISHYNAQFIRELLADQDEDACREKMADMAASDTHWVPTLTTLQMSAKAIDKSFR